MITKDSIQSAYCFFHQKWNVYARSKMDWQKDDIVCAISSYADSMSRELYEEIAEGKADFLHDYNTFANDLKTAVEKLEKRLESYPSTKE